MGVKFEIKNPHKHQFVIGKELPLKRSGNQKQIDEQVGYCIIEDVGAVVKGEAFVTVSGIAHLANDKADEAFHASEVEHGSYDFCFLLNHEDQVIAIGLTKEQNEAEQINPSDFHSRLAAYFGLTVDELQEYGGDVAFNTDPNGVKIGNYIKFKEETPEYILEKIKNMDTSKTVYFDVHDILKGY